MKDIYLLLDALKGFADMQNPQDMSKYPHLYGLPRPTLHLATRPYRINLQFNGFAIYLHENGTFTWEDTSG